MKIREEIVPVPVDSIAVGHCYLTATREVWKVHEIVDGMVTFTARDCKIGSERWGYRPERPVTAFASRVEREVPCNFALDPGPRDSNRDGASR